MNDGGIMKLMIKEAPRTVLPFWKLHLLVLLLTMSFSGFCQEKGVRVPESGEQIEEQTQSRIWIQLLDHPQEWYSTRDAAAIAGNILIYQRKSGGWPKNIDLTEPLDPDTKQKLQKNRELPPSTIDNGATYTQMRFLARIFRATNSPQYARSFLRGLDYLLKAQYKNGGWPQFYPKRKGYYSHITFNDDAMTGALALLRDIVKDPVDFGFVDSKRREEARAAVQKGIECILKCQIEVDGQLTAWCAQHDEKTFQPAKARAYELPSLSGEESVNVVRFLMSVENPDEDIIQAVQAAVAWFNAVRIEGLRIVRVPDSTAPDGWNKVAVSELGVPSIWARFYEIGTNTPFFCNRDGIVHYKYDELTSERRNNYAWYGYWPRRLLESEYPEWVERWKLSRNVLKE